MLNNIIGTEQILRGGEFLVFLKVLVDSGVRLRP